MTSAPVVLLHTDAPDAARAIVAAEHPDLTIRCCDSYEGLPATLAELRPEVCYSVRFSGTAEFPAVALIGSAGLRWLSIGGSGIDHLPRWDPARLTVTNAAGVAAGMMAEYALGAMLAFSLDLRGFARAQKERRWTDGRVAPIEGRTLLILGLGQTGQAAARRAKAMGMEVLGVRARPGPTENVDEVYGMEALPELWPRADFILVAVPLLPTTRGLVNAAAFAAMKPGAVLIDVSRGFVVDEAALIAALEGGPLKGAALDVFATEPLPESHAFWGMENVIVTPHCSSVYDGWAEKSVRMFAENLARYRQGSALANVVDPARGY
ncbi:Hydroxypyruvate reductase [Defluviimonas aquaemixtae]|uniref:Hydroxypyruvate reductase n=1 Tax=Albidovulum aquaemixtae TaxID=1542388 RepID=A0A2R8BIU7_9RHOB|nr:D-2-hydroxyacid dehydrogenase [Defluviimonas aquaemixtae]SPH23334.1 Hydroxypyruvate reductase [Defluviimonas aquaemixtae]